MLCLYMRVKKSAIGERWEGGVKTCAVERSRTEWATRHYTSGGQETRYSSYTSQS